MTAERIEVWVGKDSNPGQAGNDAGFVDGLLFLVESPPNALPN
jgi:hypothetical protein